MNAREEREILDWISPIPYGKHHISVREARTSGTCEWLLQNEKFCEWWNINSSAVLWLQGSSKRTAVHILEPHDADIISWNGENIPHFYDH